ncbi:hypothetical protein ACA910_009468 [Epithemia clementina (nom. ined.)]
MKAILVGSLCIAGASAFSPPAAPSTVISQRPNTFLRLSSTDDEIARLRAAAAKAREEAEKLSKELGKEPVATAAPAAPKKSLDEFQAILPTLISESDVIKQAEKWADLKASKTVTGFGQAVLRSFPVSLKMLEQRTGLTPESLGFDDRNVNLDDFKYATLFVLGGSSIAGVASLALLPSNIGPTLCYLFALVPIIFLGVGSSAPEFIANAIASIKGNGEDSVSAQERICRHEAAHFCCGYWCGLPVSGYSVMDGVARVEFGVGSQKFSETEVAALAVTALSGLAAEAMKWKKAEGASADLLQLQEVFRKSKEFIGAAQQQDLTRWGALTAVNLLRSNEEKYEKVVEAFRRQASVDECIVILES